MAMLKGNAGGEISYRKGAFHAFQQEGKPCVFGCVRSLVAKTTAFHVEEPASSHEESPEISSNLLMKALNFHGQELLRALKIEQGEKFSNYVDTKCLNYVEYHKRAPQAEFSLRSKRLRLLQFIAKKADMLFKPFSAEADSTQQNEDLYAVIPPIEKHMVVPLSERKRKFFEDVQRGDVLIGTVRSRNHPSMVGNLRGHCILQLTCFSGRKKRYIEDLHIKAEVNSGEYNFNDLIRGYVCSLSPSTKKIIIGTDYPPDTVINKNLLNSMGNRHLTMGRISLDDYPKYMRLTDDPMILEKIPSFHNPAAVENLCIAFGLPVINSCTSLMKKLTKSEVSKEEYAVGLKKKQMSVWAMRRRQEGAQYSKEDKLTDAFQCLNSALSIDPENSDSLIDRGCLFVSMENFEKAIDDFKAALSYDPENSLARKYISDAYMMLGEKFAALSDIDLSYENFRRAVEYNSSNHEAVTYLTAIMSVKTISDAEKAAQRNSDAEEADETPVTVSLKESEEPALVSTTSDVWPTTSEVAWQNSNTSWLSSYANTSWLGSDTLVYTAPSSNWQTSASAWSSPWSGSTAPWPMTSSTWTPAMSGSFPVPPASGAISSIMPNECRSMEISEQEHSLDKSENAMDMVPLDQLKHMIEEERDRHVLKRSRSRSVSSSSTSTSSRKKRHSSRKKKRRYRDSGSGGDDSGHSSESSLVDEHKQKCEEFVERNRRQIERKKAHSRDSKGTSKKVHKEESSNRKDHHRKLDVVHKKDCVKKINRTSVKDQDKNAHKDSVSVTKEQKSKVELSHVLDVDSEQEEPGEIFDSRHDTVATTGNTPSISPEAVKPSVLCSAAQDYMDSESKEPKRQKVFFVFKKGQNILNKKSATKPFEDKTVAQYFGEDSDEEDTVNETDAADLRTQVNHEGTGGVFKNSSASFHRRNYRSSHHDDDLSESECSKTNESVKVSKNSKCKNSPKQEKVHEKSSQHQSSHHRSHHRHYCSKHSSKTRHKDCSPQDHSSGKGRYSDSEEEYYRNRRHKDYTDYRERRHYY